MDYDLVIVGGGLAGSGLGLSMSRHGARVLIVEREKEFRDRVRGEVTHPWGTEEACKLGIYQPLVDSCGHLARWWETPQERRDLVETTACGLGCLNFYHPEMQQRVIDLAVEAGAELLRPAEAVAVTPGDPPTLVVRSDGTEHRISARLVVGADGRSSKVGVWAGFARRRDPNCLLIVGTMHRDLDLPEDTVRAIRNPGIQYNCLIIPIGQRRFRTYLMFPFGSRRALSGRRDHSEYVAGCVAAGASAGWFRYAENCGPLASFNAADHWIDRPYRDGVVLIGEAAAAPDPSFGSGLSLTMRDVRVLRDYLVEDTDWMAAAAKYADEHDRYYGSIHRQHDWARALYYTVGPAADALRAHALPRHAEDPSCRPDTLGLGPDAPGDETARRRFFAET